MPFPLALLAGAALAGAGANLYSQYKQRELYRYQRNAYERQYADWQKNTPGRSIRYPELSYPGRIRTLDTGISQSYASSLGTASRLVGQFSGGYMYRRSSGRSLYSKSTGRTSKYL